MDPFAVVDSASPCSSEARVDTVPARPMRRLPVGRWPRRGTCSIGPRPAPPARPQAAAASSPAVGGSWPRWRSVKRTQPMSSETASAPAVAADHQLGRAAPDVDHHVVAADAGGRSAVAPAKASRPSSSPERSSAGTPRTPGRRLEELGPVDGVAHRRGGGHPGRADAEAVHHRAVLGQDGERPGHRLGVELAGGVHPLAQPGDAHAGGSRVRPSAPATSSRVELVPQSTAATGPRGCSGMQPIYHTLCAAALMQRGVAAPPAPLGGRSEPEVRRHPLPHRVVPARQPPGQVGVQALHPLAGPPDPARRTRAAVVRGQQVVAGRGVARVGGGERHRVDLGLGPADPAVGLQPADGLAQLGVDQPEAWWAWASRRRAAGRWR